MASKEKVDRVSTGIIGLDEMLFGGVPKKNQILIHGDAGTGKTLLTFEIAYRNAKIDIPTTYVSLEETKDDLISNVKSAYTTFDDVDELISNNILQIVEIEALDVFKSRENWETFIVKINKLVKANQSEVLILDSLTTLRPLAEDDRTFTRYVNSMIENFKNLGITTFVTLEYSNMSTENSGLYGTFMFDGLVRLTTVSTEGSFQYLLTVVKMRKSNHRNSAAPYEITPKGFNIFK
ncbi:MAG: AAA family ATPase [Candidatus Micrarchaeota archaeon]|nr:AAA family ATPase [Candidatus Micrarchaeota archaeon]MDE1834325.1 AAA family ATPase [Candidatus Micrarchaeota archaeon]MDE1859102.1 AAA family ATPase [Candidatus Micrarchaeota archaeon]